MKPIKDRVIIKQDAAKEATKGGIILAPSAKQPSPRGTILAVGPEVTEVKEGDIVLFNVNYHQTFRTADGEEYITLCDKDILAILAPDFDVSMSKTS